MKNVIVVEESLQNSIGRYESGEPLNEVLFQVIKSCGNYYLIKGVHNPKTYYHDSIAVCRSEYRETHGGIKGWLKKIHKKESVRVSTISEKLYELQRESENRQELMCAIRECVTP
jgi:hypothetical protein